jgi:dimeric dUTPase (all-alpha-NTP-PPase superfamily)
MQEKTSVLKPIDKNVYHNPTYHEQMAALYETMFDMQHTLDKKIRLKRGLQHARLKKKKQFALFVEIGEFANEWGGFKYWKFAHHADRDAMREEYIDIVHFTLSLGIELSYKKLAASLTESYTISKDIETQLMRMVNMASSGRLIEGYPRLFALVRGLGHMLGMDDEDIFKEYRRKNEINYKRLRRL